MNLPLRLSAGFLFPGIRVFAFHEVPSADDFERTLDAISCATKVVHPGEVIGQARLQTRNAALLTFDDGHKSVVDHALPVLQERSLTAMMFVCPGLVEPGSPYWWDVLDAAEQRGFVSECLQSVDNGRSLTSHAKAIPDYQRRVIVREALEFLGDQRPIAKTASTDSLRSWLDAGMMIGNHSWDHPCLDQCDPENIESQIELSHEWLHGFDSGFKPVFAYPNGDWSPVAEQTLRKLGYSAAFLFDHRIARRSTDPLRFSRLRLDVGAKPRRIRVIASGVHSAMFHAIRRPSPVVVENQTVFAENQLVASYEAAVDLHPSEEYLFRNWIPPNSDVFDVGVGTGRTTHFLVNQARTYVGTDVVAEMIESARRLHPGVQFDVADASDLSRWGDETFDAIVFSYNGLDYLHPAEKRQQALREFKRVLRPGGVLIYSSHNPRAVVVRLDRQGLGLRARCEWLVKSSYATLRAVLSLMTQRPFWKGSGYATDRFKPLLTHYATRSHLIDELRRAGLVENELVAGDHPRSLRWWRSPWTYVVAHRPQDICVDQYHGIDSIDALAGEWNDLLESSKGSAFQSCAWIRAWYEFFGGEGRFIVLTARDSTTNELVGLLPLAQMHRRIHRKIPVPLTYWGIAGGGAGAADHLGPLANNAATASALLLEATRLAGKRSLYLESIGPSWVKTALTIPGSSIVKSTQCAVSTRSVETSFTASWSPKFQKNDRRRQRLLGEQGVTSTWIPAGPDFLDALHELQAVHRIRWQSKGTEGLFDEQRVGFIQAFAQRSTAPNCPWILLLRRDSQTIAGLLGFRFGESFSVYKTGWDPSFASLGLGLALGAEAMRWSQAQGLLTFDYLRGERSHKVDLGCKPVVDSSILVPRGLSGAALNIRERMSSDGVRLRRH